MKRDFSLQEMLHNLEALPREIPEVYREFWQELAEAIADRLQEDDNRITELSLENDALLEERDGLRESLANQEWTLKQAELMLRAEGVDHTA